MPLKTFFRNFGGKCKKREFDQTLVAESTIIRIERVRNSQRLACRFGGAIEQFEVFRNYLSTFLSVPPIEWLHILKFLKIRRLKKGEHYFVQGQTFDEIGFVVRGLLYNYYTTQTGEFRVKAFLKEADPVTCYSDLLKGTPPNFSCMTVEETTLIVIKYKDLLELYERHKCWERMGRISAEKLFILKEEREYEFLMMDAKGRYERFIEMNEAIVHRLPLYLIASFIGISPASLSRLRNESVSLPKN